jgi:hypothetical protein
MTHNPASAIGEIIDSLHAIIDRVETCISAVHGEHAVGCAVRGPVIDTVLRDVENNLQSLMGNAINAQVAILENEKWIEKEMTRVLTWLREVREEEGDA